ncbi:MAG: serine/threonine protein kinase [Myxacorys californica WJT36-NPBG1]|jgi:serine/threonine protein kinase|nr:serine/threonine protein kinase [Myxacorys californica WJT36-NPBG1]
MELLQNRYQVEGQLGKKAGRQTVLARDLETQERVVIKLLTFGVDFEWDDLKLFEREAETLRSLDHPAIPKYLDYFEIETATTRGFAIVQSYIDAKSLEQHLKAGRSFTEADVKQLAESLLDILGYLHTQHPSVIHRDIKPSNILLSDYPTEELRSNRTGHHVGQVYLVDFGSVQTLVAQEGGTITVVGTYGYMPPEQYGGRATPASDLYSLGATLIYLTTGKHPADLPQRNLQLQFRSFATLSEPFLDWLEWLIEPSLENRLGSAQVALEALRDGEIRSEKLSAIAPTDPAITPQITTDRLFWNAIWRSSTFGGIAGIVSAALLSFSTTYELSGGIYTLINWLAAASLIGGLGLGLGFANGLLIAFLTKRFFSSPHSSNLYRLTLGFAVTVFSAALIVLILNLFSSSWVLVPGLLPAVLVLDVAMSAASQAIATWYLRESRRIASKNDLKIPQQSLKQSLEKIQEGNSAEPVPPLALTNRRSAKLQRIDRKPAPALTKERVLWNAIWRFSTVGASVSAVLFSTYAKFSSSYSSDLRVVALNMVLAAIMGGSLGLGLGFLNGLLSGLLTLRSTRKDNRLRWGVGILVSLFSAGLVYSVLLLSSTSWIPLPLFILVLSLSMGLTSQSFIRWYLRETRSKPPAKTKPKVRLLRARSRSLPVNPLNSFDQRPK